jgi:hypothetical protein
MSRPGRPGPGFPLLSGTLGGSPDQPGGQPPEPDCCNVDDTDLPDRANEDNGGAMVALSSGGAPSIVQTKFIPSILSNSIPLDAPPTEGNTLVMLVSERDHGGAGEPSDPALGGWTTIGKADTVASGGFARGAGMWYRVVTADESGVTLGGDGQTYKCGSNGDRGFIVEIVGTYASVFDTQDSVASTTEYDCGGSVSPPSADPHLVIGVTATKANGGAVTEDADVTAWIDTLPGGFSPYTWMGYRATESTSAVTVGGTAASADVYCGVTAVFAGTGSAAWVVPTPSANDEDDSTYHTISNTDLLRVDLGAAYRIQSTRIRIAATNAGARTFTIKGANAVDFSDEVTLHTIAFTATGGLTAQDVTGDWYTEDSYRYFELSISDSDTYRLHTWELYEPTLATNHQHPAATPDAADVVYDNSGSGLTADDVQDAIDELAADLAAGAAAERPALTLVVDAMSSWWAAPKWRELDGSLYGGSVASDGEIQAHQVLLADLSVVTEDLGTHEQDDHNAPALVIEDGKVPVVIYARHNEDDDLRYRRGTVAGDLTSLGSESTIDLGTLVSYAQAWPIPDADEIHVFSRESNRYWVYVWSDDWGVTWDSVQQVFDFGASEQGYIITVPTAADPTILRVALSRHPTIGTAADIYYCEIDLATGAVTKSDGTSLGNIRTGSSLPIVVTTECEVAVDIDTGGGEESRLFDVSDGPVPEIAYATWTDLTAPDEDTMYHIVSRSGTTWGAEQDIVAAGVSFGSDAAVASYLGGMTFPRDTPGRTVVLSREDGDWYIERWTRGSTAWVSEQLATSTDPIVRPMVVDRYVLWHVITAYVTFDDWSASLAGVELPATGSAEVEAAALDYGEDGDISTLAFDDVADAGELDEVARADHVHGMPSEPTAIGPILISDTPSTPLVFADLIQNEAQDDLVYADP